MNPNHARAQPWYREPWPWILMAGPALVVVAACYTAWLAVRSDDGLVVDDYYKQGLAINQTLGRSQAAERLGITADVRLIEGRVQVRLGAVRSGSLTLLFAHPTLAGMDQMVKLSLVQPGVYEGQLLPLRSGRWHVVLEQRDWRLTGDWMLPAQDALALGGNTPPSVGEEYWKEGRR
jgi:hypothetical protein